MSGKLDGISDEFVHVSGTLYSIPLSAIILSEESEDNEYKFQNPRMLTKSGLNEAFDKEKSYRLREDIKKKTLLSPIICRWIDVDGEKKPQLVGGERRYRAISYLYEKNELVADPNHVVLNSEGEYEYKFIPAKEAYSNVLTHVFAVNDDLQALELSWSENKNRINLTDGHEIMQVIKLREHNASDEKIMNILQRDAKWLSQTDKLIEDLEQQILDDLIEGKMTRSSAMELSSIKDPEQRKKVQEAAVQMAVTKSVKEEKIAHKKLNKALDLVEEVEADIIDAEDSGDEKKAEEIKQQKSVAESAVKKAIEKKSSIAPVVKPKQVRQAKQEIIGEDEDSMPRILSAKKIAGCIAYLENVIHNKGYCNLYKYQADVSVLELLRDVLSNNISSNDEEIGLTIMDFYGE